MHAKRVPTVKELLNPEARGWAQVEMTRIEMMATPLGMQPTEYIRVSWENHPYGQLKEIGVRVVHDGTALAVWLRWDAPERHDADGVAVALPVHGRPALMTMGMPGAPIHALQWIAAKPGVRSVFATGIGSSRLGPEVGASAQAAWKNGQPSELMDILISRNWLDRFGPFTKSPREAKALADKKRGQSGESNNNPHRRRANAACEKCRP
jgi:DMSO reductase family type II enzyme heme b subunit